MLSLDAKEWKEFEGGYKIPYDASPPLRRLESSDRPDPRIIDELWQELHHQGDVGLASYAAVPHLLRIYREKNWLDVSLPWLLATIESSRIKGLGPELPDWLAEDYLAALHETAQHFLANASRITDKNFSRGALLLLAVVLRDDGAALLLGQIDIGEEQHILDVYIEHG